MAKRAGKARSPKPPAALQPRIVGIGASAGGLAALQTFFRHVPENLCLSYVVILHLAPGMHSELGSILGTRTGMPVTTVDGPMSLEPDHVYVIPPDRALILTDHEISSTRFDQPRGQRLPIDLFFRSLAAEHHDAFAIVLSGAGADGAQGVRAVKEAGGLVLVQEPREAEHPSMPNSAISAGADIVLPAAELATRLAELARAPRVAASDQPREADQAFVERIVAFVRARTGHDFSRYKRSTLVRRIERRAQVARCDGLAAYHAYLRNNPEEAQALFADLLISVTAFFRDPQAFDLLARQVIPKLFEGKQAEDRVRVWVPGCATGEEAYSVAMLLLEEAERREVRPELQVFGSDLDASGLAVARDGRYPTNIEADVREDRLKRFFEREGESYLVRRNLRDIVLFASHSLLRDPPFSRIDLVSCRNLLIYMERELQQQVVATFRYALVPNGFLFLGASETAEYPPGLFRLVEREAHLYQALAGREDQAAILPRLTAGPSDAASSLRRPVTAQRLAADGQSHREALEQAAPPSILVDESHRALHLSETAGRYLLPSAGPMSADVIELVRPELRLDLRAALYRAFESEKGSLSIPILVTFEGASRRVYLQVRPVAPESERAPRRALVMFIEGEVLEEALDTVVDPEARSTGETVRRLAEELRLTQMRLRATREESESANEELRAANEELQSINEEYRSTSEELETSKEELQSVNEELQTVNSELKLKLESVSRANSDLQNLMAATDMGTLFLDARLRIKLFTPRLVDLFNITSSDEGRPITDFTHQLEYDELAADARSVLRDLAPLDREVRSADGKWHLMRMRPYRTIDNRIDGVVITFVDISERLRMERALRDSEERLRQETQLIELSHAPIFMWDLDAGVLRWNRGCELLYGYPREEALGKRKPLLLQSAPPGGSFDEVIAALVRDGHWNGELHQTARDGRRLTVESDLELLVVDGRRLVLESTRDITERKSWEKRQELMVAELSHRVKNTLAVVQSIASQTVRGAQSADEFTRRFEGRLLALATAQRLLVDPWKGADVSDLAREQLEPYGGSGRDRLRLNGESISLPAETAVPLGLVLHELATNASKYGAWSARKGVVDLSWKNSTQGDKRHLTLVWREIGGPPVSQPTRTGFGSQLIRRGTPSSRVRTEFKADGLVCTIELPLAEDETGGARLGERS